MLSLSVATYKIMLNNIYCFSWSMLQSCVQLQIPCSKRDKRKLNMYSSQDGRGNWRPVWDSIYLWSSLSCGVCNSYPNLTQYVDNAYSPVGGKGGVLVCIIASRYIWMGRTANWCGLARRTKTVSSPSKGRAGTIAFVLYMECP